MSDLILYTSEDGQTRLQLRADGKTVWLTQLEIAELFQTTKHNISIHTKNIFKEGELAPEATVKESLTVQSEGGRQPRIRLPRMLPYVPKRVTDANDIQGCFSRRRCLTSLSIFSNVNDVLE